MKRTFGVKLSSSFVCTGLLVLLSACTIGPRTPIEDPASDFEESEARKNRKTQRESASKKDEGFRLPQAERVTDDDEEVERVEKAPVSESADASQSPAATPEANETAETNADQAPSVNAEPTPPAKEKKTSATK